MKAGQAIWLRRVQEVTVRTRLLNRAVLVLTLGQAVVPRTHVHVPTHSHALLTENGVIERLTGVTQTGRWVSLNLIRASATIHHIPTAIIQGSATIGSGTGQAIRSVITAIDRAGVRNDWMPGNGSRLSGTSASG